MTFKRKAYVPSAKAAKKKPRLKTITEDSQPNDPIEVSDENSSSVRSFPSLSNTVQPIRSRTDIPKSSPFYVPPLALLNTIKHEPQDDQDQHNTALAELRAIITVPSDDNHDDIAFKVAEDDQEYEDVKKALAGPAKRGRKKFSGRGEKRKSSEQYSTNPNTVKARERAEKMNKYEAELAATKNADNSWVSRNLKKWKTSSEFRAIPEKEQEKAVQAKKAELKMERARMFGDEGDRLIQSLLKKYGEKLKIDVQAHEDQHTQMLYDNAVPVNDPRWITIDDDLPDSKGIICNDSDIVADVRGYLFGDANQATEASAMHRYKVRQKYDSRNTSAWRSFQKALKEQLLDYVVKMRYLRYLGPMYREVEQTPVTDGDDTVISALVDKTTRLTISPRWMLNTTVKNARIGTFFTADEKRFLRLNWGLKRSAWVDLPGPVDWWPDVPSEESVRGDPDATEARTRAMKWYRETGLDFLGFDRKMYKMACKKIRQLNPPKNWDEFMLHEHDEVVWTKQLPLRQA